RDVVAWLLCHSCESRNPEKKYKYSKFLKLKARFISLYAWMPAYAGMTSSKFLNPYNNNALLLQW
ncbi:hypothetical protein, partial [Rickettsia conorii]|uniref:hypothetical protein n=1 Tax=Rickettsia conorii TaxID=781 RepID=UPI003AF0F4A0